MKRFFVKAELGKNLEITGEEHNHLAQVLRVQAGDHVSVICGDEFDYLYEVINITKKSTLLKFISRSQNTRNPKALFTVFMSAIKPDNVSLIVQKLNEIGVKELVLFGSNRSNIPVQSYRIDRLEAIAEQSCKQCFRSIPLKIRFGNLGSLTQYDKVLFANELQNGGLLNELKIDPHDNIAIIIGPEGGFTPEEREYILKFKNVTSISLGKRILRAETAAIAASSIVLAKMGEM